MAFAAGNDYLSANPVAIAAYFGQTDKFDRAVADVAERYADQNKRDHEAFVKVDQVWPAGSLSISSGVDTGITHSRAINPRNSVSGPVGMSSG